MSFAQLCTQCKCGDEFAHFCANSAIATFALVAKLCEFHICNIFAPGKFGANSIFHPVLESYLEVAVELCVQLCEQSSPVACGLCVLVFCSRECTAGIAKRFAILKENGS